MAAPSPRKKKPQTRKKRMSARIVEDEDYQLRHEKVAGTGIAKATGMICLRLPPEDAAGKRVSKVREAGATVPEIEAVAAELLAAGVELVSMESTSDYWRSWFSTLEEAGLQVQLVNASQARNLPGRPKTGKSDAQWIARLTEMGMLRPSFVPPPEIRALRQYTRQLLHLTQDRTRCWQRLEKTLEDAMCKLTSVISKLAGSVSGRAMIEAVIAGERDPQVLADLAQTRMRPKKPELARAFTGMRFEDQHAFAAAAHLRATGFLDAGITALEAQAAAHVKAIPAAWGTGADGTTGPDAGLGPDAAVLPAAARLDEITGTGPLAAILLIAEIGLDMDRFPAPDALVSRAGLFPVADQSGPRQGPGQQGPGQRLRPPAVHHGRRQRRRHLHVPRRTPQPPGLPARRRRAQESQRRGRPLHPHHRLAPPQGPPGPPPRPRAGPLRRALRRQPQDPRPHPPARSPRPRRHRDPREDAA